MPDNALLELPYKFLPAIETTEIIPVSGIFRTLQNALQLWDVGHGDGRDILSGSRIKYIQCRFCNSNAHGGLI